MAILQVRQTWNLGQIRRHGISYLLTCWHIEGERKTCEYEDRIIYRKRKLFRIENKWETISFSTQPISSSFFFFNKTFFSFEQIREDKDRWDFFFFQFRRRILASEIEETCRRCKSIQAHSSTVWISLTRWMWRLLAKVSTKLCDNRVM